MRKDASFKNIAKHKKDLHKRLVELPIAEKLKMAERLRKDYLLLKKYIGK